MRKPYFLCIVDIEGKFITQSNLLPWVNDIIIGASRNQIEIDPEDAKFGKTERHLLLTQGIHVEYMFPSRRFLYVSTTKKNYIATNKGFFFSFFLKVS